MFLRVWREREGEIPLGKTSGEKENKREGYMVDVGMEQVPPCA
jgi:hypothetical protein